uniref:Cupin-like domain-containing protein n=1 Tax=viral metagenome TaxID=1070528 RepID=A0A6C0D7W6_9ZZZZ
MIEIILVFTFIFLIYVFFYKQYSQEYSLNQIEFIRLDKLNELIYEKNPIIVSHCPQIPCVAPSTLMKTPRFKTILGDYLEKKSNVLPNSDSFETFLANESGFHAFCNIIWFNKFHTHILSEYISSLKSKICFGSKYMNKTSALYTLIIPVDGKYTCSLINPQYEKSLNNYKQYNNVEEIVIHNSQIQYIDVILKPGSILILPAHWYYIMNESETYSYYGILEYHEPISVLNNYLENR